MYLTFYLGARINVNFTRLTTIIDGMISGESNISINGIDFGTQQYETKIGEYEILPTTNLGCLQFDDVLSFLDDYYKSICCIDGEPVYIDIDNNGYDDRYEPVPAPSTDPSTGNTGAGYRIQLSYIWFCICYYWCIYCMYI